MKASYQWLKEFVPLDVPPAKLAEIFNFLGHEVESEERQEGDNIFDLEITPNRGDCLSILGLAREIAAFFDKKITKTIAPISINPQVDKKMALQIQVSCPSLCPHYSARIIDNLQIVPSPPWLQKRLQLFGFRPINNIVDITNYIMLEMGQPLHAFDYDKIQAKNGKKLMNLRLSKKGEELVTLDGKRRSLGDNALIIEDTEKIYDLAGIMGGANSEVGEKTRTIILEAAIFDPKNIRQTSKRLGLSTDASYRYERGVDPKGNNLALEAATNLILQTSPSAQAGKIYDLRLQERETAPIEVNPAKVNQILGTHLSPQQIAHYLQRLNFVVKSKGKNFLVTPPSYRLYDVKIWQDIAEEVARLYGYNKLPLFALKKGAFSPKIDSSFALEQILKDVMAQSGFQEIYSYSFVPQKILSLLKMFSSAILEIEKPLSPETKFLRPHLLPSLLIQIAKNPWAPEINIYEIGRCFEKEKESKEFLIASSKESRLEEAISNLRQSLETKNLKTRFFEVDKEILNLLKIRKKIYFCEVDFPSLLATFEHQQMKKDFEKPKEKIVSLKPIGKFPPAIFDLAFLVDTKISPQALSQYIQSLDKDIFLVENFDEFFSEKFGKDKKSLAFHIWVQNLQTTPTEEEIKNIREKIIQAVSQKFNARLRG